ncbi:MAG TPA: hypothetical protein VHW09_16365 [Bryobacteraceae bacterium]|nr:hypothetical protein [Bryobacteraceae bacterium]
MKSTKTLLLLLAVCAAAFCAVDLGNVHTVYVMPMAHGLEQYLANTLTGEHVFVIVTDPKLADAVLTDHVNASLQEKLDTMLLPPPTETKEGDKPDAPKGSIFEPANKVDNPAQTSSFSHSKGMVFLVGTKSRQVLWSSYDLPKDTTSKELDRIASDIVSRLRKDMGLAKK